MRGSNYFEIRSEKQVAIAGACRTVAAARSGAGQVGEYDPPVKRGCSLNTKIATTKRFGGLDRWPFLKAAAVTMSQRKAHAHPDIKAT